MINGTAKDVLDYEEAKGKGLKVIAIGGDKLARGLTLEGLCTSYFLRASKMYDTLMQMGRWFGYRSGYLDLGRIYTSPDLVRWFRHITDAAAELREEFDLMASSGATPREYGLRIQSHTELLVTSQLKMRSARTLRLSFSGQLMQTVSLPRDADVLKSNFNSASVLIESLEGGGEVNPSLSYGPSKYQWYGNLWRRVPSSSVVDFLRGYRTSEVSHRVNSVALADFIDAMVGRGELKEWSVALLGLKDGKPAELVPGTSVNMVRRKEDGQFEDRYSIGVLLDPKDEAIDIDYGQWNAALQLTAEAWARTKKSGTPEVPSGPSIRRVKGCGGNGVGARPETGLLVLYVLDPVESRLELDETTPGLVAFGVSFPESGSGVKIDYKINNVAWEHDYGAE